MYGKRGRFGLITLASDTSVLPEYQLALPEGMQVYVSPILLPGGRVSAEALSEMLEGDQLERAAELLKWSGAQSLLFACTTGSLVHGLGWDQLLAKRIERSSGLPATTTASAVVNALREVGAQTVAVATPYTNELNLIEADFLRDSGFGVAAIAGHGCVTDMEIGQLEPADATELVKRVDQDDADAIFISCTNFHVLEAIEAMEAAHGKPVVTSNQAGVWQLLEQAGWSEPVPGFGALLRLLSAAKVTH